MLDGTPGGHRGQLGHLGHFGHFGHGQGSGGKIASHTPIAVVNSSRLQNGWNMILSTCLMELALYWRAIDSFSVSFDAEAFTMFFISDAPNEKGSASTVTAASSKDQVVDNKTAYINQFE